MQQQHRTFRALRGVALLALSLGMSAAASAQQSTFVCASLGPAAPNAAVPAVIHYDFGLESQQYINTVSKSYDASNPAASCAEILVEPGTEIYVRQRIRYTDGSMGNKPEISVRQNRWGGGSSTTTHS